jgi:hypothetical protein
MLSVAMVLFAVGGAILLFLGRYPDWAETKTGPAASVPLPAE